MANPQLEDGRTEIANEIVEALAKVNLSAYESRVLWCVFRKTYGWHKKIDRISYTQFEETTGMKRWHIARTIKLLLARQMITCQGEGHNLEYGVQKDYEQWQNVGQVDIKTLPKEVTKDTGSTVTPLGNGETPDNRYLIRRESLPNQVASLPKEVTESLPKEVNTKAIKHYTKALTKAYGEFSNVNLSDEEYQKLKEKFGEVGTGERIETLSYGIASKGYKYKNHYATILSWDRKENKHQGRKLPDKLESVEEFLAKKKGDT